MRLNIFNGYATGGTYKQAKLPGDILVWNENYLIGPLTYDPYAPNFIDLRSDSFDEFPDYKKTILKQLDVLDNFSKYSDVVLWFDHDLFCQTMLSFLLNWFNEKDLGESNLSLICIDKFSGLDNFKGLGQLKGIELSSLIGTQVPVNSHQLTEGSLGWKAYASDDPRDIEKFLVRDQSALPFLNKALKYHLKRISSLRNGLGIVENTLLKQIHNHPDTTMVRHIGEFLSNDDLFGGGDLGCFKALEKMVICKKPLISTNNSSLINDTGSDLRYNGKCRLNLTELGYEVLGEKKDFIWENGIDEWIGGVHLLGMKNIWRYNNKTESLCSK